MQFTRSNTLHASLCNCIIYCEYYISPDPFIRHSFRPDHSPHTPRPGHTAGNWSGDRSFHANPIRRALTQHFHRGPARKNSPSSQPPLLFSNGCAPQKDATWRCTHFVLPRPACLFLSPGLCEKHSGISLVAVRVMEHLTVGKKHERGWVLRPACTASTHTLTAPKNHASAAATTTAVCSERERSY